MAEPAITVVYQCRLRRLRPIYRSAGWPRLDMTKIELLAAGLLERRHTAPGHETVRVTDAGLAVIAETLGRDRARRSAHELLAERVARELTRAGRIARRGLSMRAKVDDAWALSMRDVFSLPHTTVEAYFEPIVHKVKVHRANQLSYLRSPTKRAAYLQPTSECW